MSDLPPPLEDGVGPSALLAAAAAVTGGDARAGSDDLLPEFVPPRHDAAAGAGGDDDEGPTLLEQMMAESSVAIKRKRQEQEAKRRKEDATFGAGISARAVTAALATETRSAADNTASSGGGGAGGGAGAGAGASTGSAAGAQVLRSAVSTPKAEAQLLRAAAKGNLKALQVAVSQGANLDARAPTKAGQTALALAAHGGHVAVCQYLLNQGADPNTTTAVRRRGRG